MRVVWDLPLSPDGILLELNEERRVLARPIRSTDRDALLAAFDRMSLRSRYQRFFSPLKQLPDTVLDKLVDIDHETHLAWAIADPEAASETGDEGGLAIAVGRIIIEDDDPTYAEAALSVVDDYQRMGIGGFLVDLLASTAAQVGVTMLRFEVLKENRGIRQLLANRGASPKLVIGDNTVLHYLLPVPSIDDVDVPAGSIYELLRLNLDRAS